MNAIRSVFSRAVVSGVVAAGMSAAVAALCGKREGATPYAPLNAVAHCLWPRTALTETGPSARFTLTGLAIHHAAGIFWGVLFETLLMRRKCRSHGLANAVQVSACAGATAAAAYVVDYYAVPARLTPGFEAHLSGRSIFYVYAGLTAGLAMVALIRSRDAAHGARTAS